MRIAGLIGALALAGCMASAESRSADQSRAERELADALKDRVAGTPADCISISSTGGPQIVDARTLLYRQGRKVWRNDLEASCPGLDAGDTLIVEIHGSQLCRNDLFRVHEMGSSIPGPFCRMGKFTPYTKAK